MNNLRTIDDAFVDEYIFNHRKNLGKPLTGGTDWRFCDIIAPAFREILEIAQAENVLEIGLNAGGSALMFLSIDPYLVYDSVDIVENKKSIDYLSNHFTGFSFYEIDSKNISPKIPFFNSKYDLVFLDGDHSPEGVLSDIEVSLKFNPDYILFDDYRHKSHYYIEDIVTHTYKGKLEVVKVWEFPQAWNGYSMALCKVKK